MFDLGYTELLLVAIVALIVVGPKDLPKLMRTVGNMVAKVRATARHFKSGMDEMIRQSELDEMRAKWDAHNAAIMKETGAADGRAPATDLGEPTATPPPRRSAPPGEHEAEAPLEDKPLGSTSSGDDEASGR